MCRLIKEKIGNRETEVSFRAFFSQHPYLRVKIILRSVCPLSDFLYKHYRSGLNSISLVSNIPYVGIIIKSECVLSFIFELQQMFSSEPYPNENSAFLKKTRSYTRLNQRMIWGSIRSLFWQHWSLGIIRQGAIVYRVGMVAGSAVLVFVCWTGAESTSITPPVSLTASPNSRQKGCQVSVWLTKDKLSQRLNPQSKISDT